MSDNAPFPDPTNIGGPPKRRLTSPLTYYRNRFSLPVSKRYKSTPVAVAAANRPEFYSSPADKADAMPMELPRLRPSRCAREPERKENKPRFLYNFSDHIEPIRAGERDEIGRHDLRRAPSRTGEEGRYGSELPLQRGIPEDSMQSEEIYDWMANLQHQERIGNNTKEPGRHMLDLETSVFSSDSDGDFEMGTSIETSIPESEPDHHSLKSRSTRQNSVPEKRYIMEQTNVHRAPERSTRTPERPARAPERPARISERPARTPERMACTPKQQAKTRPGILSSSAEKIQGVRKAKKSQTVHFSREAARQHQNRTPSRGDSVFEETSNESRRSSRETPDTERREQTPTNALTLHDDQFDDAYDSETSMEYTLSDAIVDMYEIMATSFWTNDTCWLLSITKAPARSQFFTSYSNDAIENVTKLLEVIEWTQKKEDGYSQVQFGLTMQHRITDAIQHMERAINAIQHYLAIDSEHQNNNEKPQPHFETLRRMRQYLVPRMVAAIGMVFTLLRNPAPELRRIVIFVLDSISAAAEKIGNIIRRGVLDEEYKQSAAGFLHSLRVVRAWVEAEIKESRNNVARKIVIL